jgi:DNA-binding LacI/PurR family transcriptional regulator
MPSENEDRPTLLKVAREAGVSLAAASMGLRNHPRIGIQTRKRIQSAAKKLGYTPDPQLSRLMWHLRNSKAVKYQETLAFLSDNTRISDWAAYSQSDYYLGAADRAGELGYRVEIFHLHAPGLTQANLSRMLGNRGIRGIITSAFKEPGATLSLDWKQFATVACGYSLASPEVDRTTTDYYRAMLMATEKLAREGAQRIGLCLNVTDDAKVMHLWLSAFLFYQHHLPERQRLPVHKLSSVTWALMAAASKAKQAPAVRGQPAVENDLRAWFRATRPDAVISAGCDFPQEYEQTAGVPAPAGVRYCNMNIHHADARSCGINQDSYLVGRHACSHLVALLTRNELGLPGHPQITFTEFHWIENWNEWNAAWQKRNARLRDPAAPRGASIAK